jgi:hypothetical protein
MNAVVLEYLAIGEDLRLYPSELVPFPIILAL